MPKAFCLAPVLLLAFLQVLPAQAQNLVKIGDLEFNLNIHADKRVSDYAYQDISFQTTNQTWPDSTVILYSSPELDLTLNISTRGQYLAPASLFSFRADFKQETYLHELYLTMDNPAQPVRTVLKGVEAILSGDPSRDRNITPYMDKAVQYQCDGKTFWIVASGYNECEGIEGLAGNRIHLYDYRVHFFRAYKRAIQSANYPRDTMYMTEGSVYKWGFLVFTGEPVLLDINRWLGDKRAALCISNDADGETPDRLKAVYEGSNNPTNPKYHTQGFFARNIPVTNTIHGVNQPTLEPLWDMIMEHGNTIGWHTYTMLADPPGANEQALLHDLTKYNIRTWIDHCVPNNPEDIIYNGLYPDSLGYVADVINQSSIDYVWPADTPLTNPFDAYDEPWYLPHIVYEAKTFTRPIWFFGRTRTETWEYTNAYTPVCMKYIMTPANLEQLLADRGLHHSYTHLCSSQTSTSKSYWQIAPNGDYEVRGDVDEMLQMLDYYRNYRGLWIATLEDIYDRMLAIEQVKVTSVQRDGSAGAYTVTLSNASDMDITDLCLYHGDLSFSLPFFAQGTEYNLELSSSPAGDGVPVPPYRISYLSGNLVLKKSPGGMISPITLDIYNLRGQKLLSRDYQYSQSEILLPFAGYPSGIYLARIREADWPAPAVIKFTVVK
jgi:hypothetical protein